MFKCRFAILAVLVLTTACFSDLAWSADDSSVSREELDALKTENEKLRKEVLDASNQQVDEIKNAKLEVQRALQELRLAQQKLQQAAGLNEAAPEDGVGAPAGDHTTQAEYDKVLRENDRLRKKVETFSPIETAAPSLDNMVDNRLGQDKHGVRTKTGRLTIGGLVQVWFYSIKNDAVGFIDSDTISLPRSGYSSNEVNDNDSFRIRRAQLTFDVDVTEHLSAHIMIDPAKEADSFPNFPSNLGNGVSGESNVYYNTGLALEGNAVDGFTYQPTGNLRNETMRSGSGSANRLLQDAYIKWQGQVPHHTFYAGQMRRPLGEEGRRDPAELDFIERAIITQPASVRDMGLMAEGEWFDKRLQYWVGVFNGAGTAFQSRYNRSNTEDDFDLVFSILGRPLWNHETFGSLELGASYLSGWRGEAGARGPFLPSDNDGLNQARTKHAMVYAWAHYRPTGPVRGWWIRGEYGMIRDRFARNEVRTFPDDITGVTQDMNGNWDIQGWTLSTGYRLSDSRYADSFREGNFWQRNILSPIEFTFRYENTANLMLQSDVRPRRELDVFHTTVYTAGINYYIHGHNAKLQINYNWVNEEDAIDNRFNSRQATEVSNDNLVVNFQLSW